MIKSIRNYFFAHIWTQSSSITTLHQLECWSLSNSYKCSISVEQRVVHGKMNNLRDKISLIIGRSLTLQCGFAFSPAKNRTNFQFVSCTAIHSKSVTLADTYKTVHFNKIRQCIQWTCKNVRFIEFNRNALSSIFNTRIRLFFMRTNRISALCNCVMQSYLAPFNLH